MARRDTPAAARKGPPYLPETPPFDGWSIP